MCSLQRDPQTIGQGGACQQGPEFRPQEAQIVQRLRGLREGLLEREALVEAEEILVPTSLKRDLTYRKFGPRMTLTREQGTQLVLMARNALEEFVRNDKVTIPAKCDTDHLNEKRGVFVTLKKSDGSLRGCVGFPFPTKSLGRAIIEATVAAAANDPRFPRVERNEVADLSVEVSVLTQPQVISVAKPTEYPDSVRIGEDGLIVSAGKYSGLLLPQVATEFGLGSVDFLSETCVKAGLMPDAWLSGKVVVQKFQTEIFSEEEEAREKVGTQPR